MCQGCGATFTEPSFSENGKNERKIFGLLLMMGQSKFFCATFVAYFYSSWALQQRTPLRRFTLQDQGNPQLQGNSAEPTSRRTMSPLILVEPKKSSGRATCSSFLPYSIPLCAVLGGCQKITKKLGALSDYSFPDTLVQWCVLRLAYVLLGSLLCEFVCCFAMPPPAPSCVFFSVRDSFSQFNGVTQ